MENKHTTKYSIGKDDKLVETKTPTEVIDEVNTYDIANFKIHINRIEGKLASLEAEKLVLLEFIEKYNEKKKQCKEQL